jgi:chorismate lyase
MSIGKHIVWRRDLNLSRLRRQGVPRLGAWLKATGSLTQHLSHLVAPVTVRRLSQGASTARPDETHALGMGTRRGRRVHVREVLLRCEGQTLVMARSVCEIRHLKGPWRALKGLGSRPLAELLFHDREVQRLPLSTAYLAMNSRLGRAQAERWARATGNVWTAEGFWQRRSIFVRRGAALLVAELFAAPVHHIAGPSRIASPDISPGRSLMPRNTA